MCGGTPLEGMDGKGVLPIAGGMLVGSAGSSRCCHVAAYIG